MTLPDFVPDFTRPSAHHIQDAAGPVGVDNIVRRDDGSVSIDVHVRRSELTALVDLMAWTERLEAATGPVRAATVADFAAGCMTRVGSVLRPATDIFRAGTIPPIRGSPEVRAGVASDPTLAPIPAAMAAIEEIPGQRLHRRELWRE